MKYYEISKQKEPIKYDFHRDFYENMLDSIEENSVTFLLGTRKCGKTVCLNQLHDQIENAEFIDFKTIPDSYAQMDVFHTMIESIKRNQSKVYLLDEITYVTDAESKICEIADAFSMVKNHNTKFVFTGSQSVALNAWADRAFAGNVKKIAVDFLTYSEFLRYKGLTDHTPETYQRFLYEAADFYHFKSLKGYLEACIEETIVSNAKSSNYIFDNECDLISDKVDILVNICYQTLLTLHNNVRAETFFKNDKVKDTLIGTFHETCKKLGNDSIAKKIENSFIGSYRSIQSTKIDILKQAFMFLKKCQLISITPIARELDDVPDVLRGLRTDRKSDVDCKNDLFKKFNVTINYPMFYVQILKDILGEDMPDKLPGTILGSIVECQARGLLPDGFELRKTITENGIERECEVDYINFADNTAVEFSISVDHSINFRVLPEDMSFLCLTRNKNTEKNGIRYMDYCSYLFDLSQSKYLSKHAKETMREEGKEKSKSEVLLYENNL